MGLITCAGLDVERGRLHLPYRGAWYGTLKLDGATAPSGKVALTAVGGWKLAGTIARAGVFVDSAHVSIVGGAGGLGSLIAPAAYQNSLLRDPLAAIVQGAGEALSPKIDQSLLAAVLPAWTNVAQPAAAGLDRLAFAAGQALRQAIAWRVLDDGTVWLGVDAWPAQTLPPGSDVLAFYPDEGRYEIGAETPSLLPGVDVAGVGRVLAADHWIEAHQIRSWAWVS